MNNEIPTLTFEPFYEVTSNQEPVKQQLVNQDAVKLEKPVLDESTLTPEEQKMINDFAEKIDFSKSNLILQYGVGAQKKIADFS